MIDDLPNVMIEALDLPTLDKLGQPRSTHPPRILLLYGSVRQRSYSRFLTHEAERLLRQFGCETRVFDPSGLPLSRRRPRQPSQGAGVACILGVVRGASLVLA